MHQVLPSLQVLHCSLHLHIQLVRVVLPPHKVTSTSCLTLGKKPSPREQTELTQEKLEQHSCKHIMEASKGYLGKLAEKQDCRADA